MLVKRFVRGSQEASNTLSFVSLRIAANRLDEVTSIECMLRQQIDLAAMRSVSGAERVQVERQHPKPDSLTLRARKALRLTLARLDRR